MNPPGGAKGAFTCERRALVEDVERSASLLARAEMERLETRVSLTPNQRAEVAGGLSRVMSRLVVEPVRAWDGDTQLAADLLGVRPDRGGAGR